MKVEMKQVYMQDDDTIVFVQIHGVRNLEISIGCFLLFYCRLVLLPS